MSGPDMPDSCRFEQNYLRESFESMLCSILVIDVNTREVVNIIQSAVAQFGELKERVTCHEFTHHEANPCTGANHECTIDEVLKTKGPVIIEHIHSQKCDEQVVIEVHASPIFNVNGEITHIIEFSFDITRQSKAIDQLAESEKKYRFIAENTVDVIFTMDLDMQITYITPNVAKIRGFTHEEIKQQQISDILTEDSITIAKETLEQIAKLDKEDALDPDRIWTLELEVKRKGGTTYPAEMTLSLIRDDEGRLVSLLGVSRNISERKRAEEESARLKEQVSHMQRIDSVGELAGGIAHDFNNLLTVISGHASLVLEDLEEGNPIKTDILEIQKAATRAASLTSQILAYSRRQMLSPKVFNLNHSLTEINEFIYRLLGENIIINLIFGENIWNVYADEGQIQQILINLATNARDAMPDGGGLKIETCNKSISEQDILTMPDVKPGKYVCISVTDEGCGIEPDRLYKIFEPFHTTKGVGKGTGLGLSMAYGTVKQHKGWINVESTVGEGTTFEVYLPAIDQEEDVAKEEKSGLEVELFGKGKKILVVEDEDSVRDLLYRITKKYGFEVFMAASIKVAKRLFESEQGKFDIILSDIILPDKGVTGCDLVLDLQQQNPDLKVVLVSGYVDVTDRWSEILNAGFPFLSKPFEVNELVELLRETLNS